jgi:uncharacterized protein (TIGR00290 family)
MLPSQNTLLNMQNSPKPKAVFAWSGGKDSSYCLHQVLEENKYEVVYLLTTLNFEFKRISMHGVKEELLDLQAESIGIPQLKVWLYEASYSSYEQQMEEMLLKAKAEGIEHVIFGDIFLEDLREYREKTLQKIGMQAVFPLWKKDTKNLIQSFIEKGFKTLTCCVNDAFFDEHWVGKEIDKNFIHDLPSNVDPCGENGEYHTYCYAGPIFKKEINICIGEKIYRPLENKNLKTMNEDQQQSKGFWYCELNAQ